MGKVRSREEVLSGATQLWVTLKPLVSGQGQVMLFCPISEMAKLRLKKKYAGTKEGVTGSDGLGLEPEPQECTHWGEKYVKQVLDLRDLLLGGLQ